MTLPTQAVKALIKKDGQLLLLQSNKKLREQDVWDFPGGLIESGESDEEALMREALEETGLVIEILSQKGSWSFTRLLDGQKVNVRNYLCRMLDEQTVIKLSDEHQAALWINPQDITKYKIKDPSLAENILVNFK